MLPVAETAVGGAGKLIGSAAAASADFAAFGRHALSVSSQVFYATAYTIAFVNVKPVVRGHILVAPRRRTPRLADLTPEELTDLFAVVARVGAALERHHHADGLSIAVQDGPAAGQTVAHTHVHVLPRWAADIPAADKDKVDDAIDASGPGATAATRPRGIAPDPISMARAAAGGGEGAGTPQVRTADVLAHVAPRTSTDMARETTTYRALLSPHQRLEYVSWTSV